MYFNWRRLLHDILRSLFPGGAAHMRLTGHRARVLVMFVGCMVWMVGSGRMGLWLDRLLFPKFRKTLIEKPVFVVGNFRSGSTLFHRLIAATPGFSAMKTWEIYFAPSISQRKFWRGFWIVDRVLGGGIKRAILHAQDRRLGDVQMHKVRLEEPEEDEALFLYLWDSMFNWFFMPMNAGTNPYWRFDQAVPEWRRRRLMGFYRGCIARHLYLEPKHTTYISKSPSFSAKLSSLLEEFPDARIVFLVRHPYDTIVSVMGWLSYAWHYFASPAEVFPFSDTVLRLAKEWYLRPQRMLDTLSSNQIVSIRYEDMLADPTTVIPRALEKLGISIHPQLDAALHELKTETSPSRSHSLGLADVGLTGEEVAEVFRETMERFGYEP